jgi:hypothetical protein
MPVELPAGHDDSLIFFNLTCRGPPHGVVGVFVFQDAWEIEIEPFGGVPRL